MLAKRIIPSILYKHGHLIKGEQFKADRIVGNALQAAKIHAMRGADELILLDVTASKEWRDPDYEMVSKLAENCFTPLTVGGGVKKKEHVRELLRSGADKVCIHDAYLWNPQIITELANMFGSQCITVSVDVYHNEIEHIKYGVKSLENMGAGEILLQSVERDGTMKGYNLDLIGSVSEAVNIPVIASGGCSGYEDMYQAIQAGADAVAVGALFQFTDATPKGAAEYLSQKGIETRL